MSDVPEGLVVGALVALVGGLIWWAAAVTGRRMVSQMGALAERLGLQLEVARFFNLVTRVGAQGTIHGRRVRFYSYTTGSGKSKTTWAALAVAARSAGNFEFKFARQGFATKVMEIFGAKEVRVGDRMFDDAWFVQTNRPDYLVAALVPEIREKLLAAHRAGGDGAFRLERGEVIYAERGSLGSAKVLGRLEATLPVLQDLADVVEVAGAGAGV